MARPVDSRQIATGCFGFSCIQVVPFAVEESMEAVATEVLEWPEPLRPGPETAALRRFHRDVTWTGTVKATPTTPEMTAKGRGTFRWSPDGLWVIGEFAQDQFYGGDKVTTWSAHYVAGWDYSRRAYVAFASDSNGRAVPFTGKIEGDQFIITSDGATIGGAPVRLRMIWDASDPAVMHWRNEMSLEGGAWMLIEEYEMRPM
jgi:hypothetical protein